MNWALPSSNAGLAVVISLVVVVSASVGFVTLGLVDTGNQPSPGENSTDEGNATAPRDANLQAECANASATASLRQRASGQHNQPTNTSSGAALSTSGAAPMPTLRGNATQAAKRGDGTMRTNIECAIANLSSPPAWLTNFTNATTNSERATPTSRATASAVGDNNTTRRVQAQRAFARDLRAILSNESPSRRAATLDAAARALDERHQVAAAGQLNGSRQSQVAAQQTNLRGARTLLRTTGTADRSGTLTHAARLATQGLRLQAARLNQSDQPTDLAAVTLPDTRMPTHDTPSAAAFALLEEHGVEPTAAQTADIRALDELPEPTQSNLTDYLDAYLAYYTTTQEVYAEANRTRLDNSSAAAGVTATPSTAELRRVRAAQLRLLEATVDLRAAVGDANSPGRKGSGANGAANQSVQVAPVLSIDLSSRSNTYETDYALQLDWGGDDTYNNSAGGNTGNISAAALADFGGSDTYRGRNGGGVWDGAGFLVDAGRGADTYVARGTPDKSPSNHPCISANGRAPEPGSWGTNGGGALGGVGFLLDAGEGNTYEAGSHGTNGGARGEFCTGWGSEANRKLALGFLLDAGTGADTYDAGDRGTNGGGLSGYGSLVDMGGADTYDAGRAATNGGGIGDDVRPLEGPIGRILDGMAPISIPTNSRPPVPATGGFLLDASGNDTFSAAKNPNNITYGANGGGASGGTGFLLSAGTANDTYEAGHWGTNGGGWGGIGFLLDEGGAETYDGGSTGSNGGAMGGAGFLVDGGGTDTYDAGAEGANGGAVTARILQTRTAPSELTSYYSDDAPVGFLLDAGTGADNYTAGDSGTNGGALGGTPPDEVGDVTDESKVQADKVPAGFLLDEGGDDSYVAGFQYTNGGAYNGIGLLVDSAGTDFYKDARVRCHDCSRIPKGSVGAQVDRGGDGESGEGSGSAEVLVVDDNAGAAGADCPDASYQAIQPAVDNASSGDTVRVCAGTYRGMVTVDTIGMTLRAAAPGQVVLDGGWSRQFGVMLQARNTTVAGFTAVNFSARGATAFVSIIPGTTIANNTVRGSSTGILHSPPDYSDVPETTIRDNRVTGTPVGIRVLGAEAVTIHGNTVTGHAVRRSTAQRGILSSSSKQIRITDNTVTGFTAPPNRTYNQKAAPFGYGYGIEILSSEILTANADEDAEHTVRNNTLANNTYNLQVYSTDPADYSDYVIDASNTVDGKPVLYLKGLQNSVIDPATEPGYLACVDCVNVTVRDMELSHNGQGVLIVNGRNTHVTNVTVHDTWRGISMRASPDHGTVTNNTIRRSYNAIAIRHDCDSLRRCVPNGPSVVVANNTVRKTGFLFTTPVGGQMYIGVDTWHGGAILVTGDGVTVRRNTIADAYGAGVSVKTGETYGSKTLGALETDSPGPVGSGTDATVANNSIADAYMGLMSVRSDGTRFTGNEITDTRIGIFNKENRDLLYRANTVTNATVGMFIHYEDINITATNNTFREVTWGLDVLFTWLPETPNAPASHNLGTSNTVNGERVVWLNGASDRVIDAADANMVVCVRCVNVTVRDTSLTDNAHGVVFWDATNSRIENVTVTDALHQGVTIIDGENNGVHNATIVDSATGIKVQPINRGNDADALETVGTVRLTHNSVTVKNASYPDAPYAHQGTLIGGWTSPRSWSHTGIILWNPSTATVADNRITNTSWGINQFVMVLRERHPQDYQYPKAAENVRIVNNTVTHPAQPMGLARPGKRKRKASAGAERLGIGVHSRKAKSPNATIRIRNNTLSDNGRGTDGGERFGIRIAIDEIPSITVMSNSVQGYGQSVRLAATGANPTSAASIRRNRLTGASRASVFVAGSTPGDPVAIHGNLLQPQAPTGSAGYGVMYANATQTVNATCNYWGVTDGPSSPGTTTLADPQTGAAAAGSGSAVSGSTADGESNVLFDPWVDDLPPTTCARDDGAIPTVTATPPSTPTDGGGGGSGDDPGDGSGDGSGDGNSGDDGADGGSNPDSKQERTSTEGDESVQDTATPSETHSKTPTGTPEIVSGFGMATGLVALVILLGVLAVRRRE